MECSVVAVKHPGSRLYQSAAYSLAVYGVKTFNISTQEWLGPAVAEVTAGGKGYISDCYARLDLTVTVPAGKFLRGVDLVDSLAFIQIRDVHGLRIELSGREHWYCMLAEKQMQYVGDFLDNTASGTPTTFTATIYVRFPCEPYGLPAEEAWWDLVEFHRGRWTLQFNTTLGNGTNNTGTVATAVLTMVCEVTEKQAIPGVDSGVRRLRTVWRSTAMKSNKDSITTAENALHRYAFYHTGSGAAKDTPDTLVNSTPAQLTSKLFGYSLIDADQISNMQGRRREHFAESLSFSNTATVLYRASDYNPFATMQNQVLADECGVAQMLWYPRPNDLGITNLPVGSAVDYQTTQAFGSGSLATANSPAIVVAYIEDDPVVAANECSVRVAFPARGGKLTVDADHMNAFALLAYGKKLPQLIMPTGPRASIQPGDAKRVVSPSSLSK